MRSQDAAQAVYRHLRRTVQGQVGRQGRASCAPCQILHNDGVCAQLVELGDRSRAAVISRSVTSVLTVT